MDLRSGMWVSLDLMFCTSSYRTVSCIIYLLFDVAYLHLELWICDNAISLEYTHCVLVRLGLSRCGVNLSDLYMATPCIDQERCFLATVPFG
jgi:hypothetical protein